MYERKCKICGKTNDLTTLRIPVDGDPPDSYSVHVCHMCWDVVTEIANRALDARLKIIESALFADKEPSK